MMGRTHALTGWCAGVAASVILGHDDVGEVVLFGATTAGFALLPDLDHPNARASRLLGIVTRALSRLLRALSAGAYRLAQGPGDDPSRTGTHRHLTHTAVFAVAIGVATAVATAAGGPWVAAGVVLLGLLLAENALGDWLLPITAASVVMWVVNTDPATALASVSGWLGIAVALGCVVHCLGDAITVSGCPFLWPIPIAGECWYEIGPPSWLRFRTGSTVETYLVAPACTLGGVLLLPGVTELVQPWTQALAERLLAN
ncbi:metal-dependent hydrolase [Actinobacteria bacterium YIM 96077]|uniref:Metal-dependent hydrolase n=1 Tax=Phytoactinopolyspora halophila TaxID=1981511 RepID=A0A329R0F2_9ACTN|nr:metal-dependent hydrolase [Phytoactinopolyspora halophila]AYY13124.1 metal-dependent hydrolase [Actinobacteria bacterium YIM 96077]RAW17636.1 metal-dependent hydrolase [Phytoactinopolyspora halophila]